MVSPLLSPQSLIRLFTAGSLDESLVGFGMLVCNIVCQCLFVPIAAGSLLLKALTDATGKSTRLKNPKVILITGASSGMGKHLAIQYSKPGVTLHLTGQNSDRLNEVANTCRTQGATVRTYVGDITAPGFQSDIVAFDAAHPIDLLIANAGTTSFDPTIKDKPWEEQYIRIIETNIFGELHTIVPILKEMRKRKSGQIAVMSSINSFFGQTYMPWYNMTKAATRSFGRDLRALMRPEGIHVSTICPGFVQSGMTAPMKNEAGATFPGPLFYSEERAAASIRHGLERDHAFIGFPAIELFQAYFMEALPPAYHDAFAVGYGTQESSGKRWT